ncbi:hypothetical protein D3C83_91910 [compost metagenome]
MSSLGLEYRPRFAAPMPFSLLKVARSAFRGEEASMVSAPQPTSMRLNSSFEPREKNTDEGMASTRVWMPALVSICAMACAICSSFT